MCASAWLSAVDAQQLSMQVSVGRSQEMNLWLFAPKSTRIKVVSKQNAIIKCNSDPEIWTRGPCTVQ